MLNVIHQNPWILDTARNPRYGEVIDEHNARYRAEINEIVGAVSSIPLRGDNTDEINATHDLSRIETIIYILKYLKVYKYLIDEHIKRCVNDEHGKYVYTALGLHYKRQLFKGVAHLIFNLSSNFKYKYKKYLTPAPFSWETFEHFGAIMIDNTHKPAGICVPKEFINNTRHIYAELYWKEKILEASIDKIIESDLDNMISFFEMIKAHEKDNEVKLEPYQFHAAKSITKRIVDVSSFMKLIHITNNDRLTEFEAKANVQDTRTRNGFNQTAYSIGKQRASRFYKLDSKLKLHAALRRLEIIGELTTGKFLSSEWKVLDKTLDWNAFHTLRDCIAHQDEGDNHAKFLMLMKRKDILNALFREDIPAFHARLQKLALEWDNNCIPYQDEDVGGFCDLLVRNESESFKNSTKPKESEKKQEKSYAGLSAEQRKAAKQADREAQAAKKLIKDDFVGLQHVRDAAAIFTQPGSSSGSTLNAKKRIQLALDALVNISNFIESETSFTLTNSTDCRLILDAIEQNEFLYDAISYNIEQFVQHLDRIKEYSGIQGTEISQNYHLLRYLRNHIAHGALLLDYEEFNPQKKSSEYSILQKQLAIAIRTYVCEYAPILRKAIEITERMEKSAVEPGRMRVQ